MGTSLQGLEQETGIGHILVFPDLSSPFLLETDASKEGLGAVLAQNQPDETVRPIAYASRTLQGAECNYASTHLEDLGVIWATRHYIHGHPCTVYTDNQVLLNTPHPSGRLARWGLSLDHTIQYYPGDRTVTQMLPLEVSQDYC